MSVSVYMGGRVTGEGDVVKPVHASVGVTLRVCPAWVCLCLWPGRAPSEGEEDSEVECHPPASFPEGL